LSIPPRYNCGVKNRWLILLPLLLIAVAGGLAWWLRAERREHSQDRVILAAAKRYGVEPALVKAVVWRESWFDPDAEGGHGERGLMQITEIAAQEWADAEHITTFDARHLFDPITNTFAATSYLAKLLRRYTQTDNPVPYALADYNAGRTHVLRWNKGAASTNSAVFLEQMDFPGTRKYVEAILQQRDVYRPVFPAPVSR
jgi:soluble lytic murein transglycosylase